MPEMRVELLQRMPIFGAIRDDALEFLLQQTRSVKVRAGAYFFRETDPADCMYVLESGRVAVLKSWQGKELLMRHLGEGDCFGEMALMDLLPRSASVRAEEDCSAIELTSINAVDRGPFSRNVYQTAASAVTPASTYAASAAIANALPLVNRGSSGSGGGMPSAISLLSSSLYFCDCSPR